jgi:hypothetical protein
MNLRTRELIKKAILKLAGKDNKHGIFSATTLENCMDEAEEDFRRLHPGKELDKIEVTRMAEAAMEKGKGGEEPHFYVSNGHFAIRGPVFSPEEHKVLFPLEFRRRRLTAKAFDDIFPPKKNTFKKTGLVHDIDGVYARVFYCKETGEVFYLDEKYMPLFEMLVPGGELYGEAEGPLGFENEEDGVRFMVMGIYGYGPSALALIDHELPGMMPEEEK